MNCPHLKPGKDYEPQGRHPVVLLRNICTHIGRDPGAFFEFYSGPHLLGYTEYTRLTICKGYACDGYSPGFWLGRKYIGLTPTPKAGIFPAIGHDFTRQMAWLDYCPWNRKDTDVWFYNWLVAGGTNPHIAGTYYRAVAGLTGSAFIAMTKKRDPRLRVVVTPYDS